MESSAPSHLLNNNPEPQEHQNAGDISGLTIFLEVAFFIVESFLFFNKHIIVQCYMAKKHLLEDAIQWHTKEDGLELFIYLFIYIFKVTLQQLTFRMYNCLVFKGLYPV